ncbi:transposase [Aporhodopirellula aestuarii]|uniref:transposase n=1 Tax=Aporhodopirellula aestuarii TaxID=2950107 RepID=UPI002033CC42|nr:transposase [Aporhodopirellula aestuarii]
MLRIFWHHDDSASAMAYFQRLVQASCSHGSDADEDRCTFDQRASGKRCQFCTHRITNAIAEGVNGKIMSTKRRVGGFHSIKNFKTAIFFYCGGLELYPR